MLKNSTRNNLVRYAYNETGLIDGDQTQRLIDGDPLVENEFKEIVDFINLLDEIKLEPSAECIKRIMAHS
ncbi:MAG TPA: hypothetical protein PKJ62_02415 [Bacteroidia bacterium]|nr:hypothetical protein [Bacteroidia bacterium]HNS11876.1 hypothetical protein [Bacteroidia bacterium]